MRKHGDECVSERCAMCTALATHKVEESTRCQDEGVGRRHPFTNYLCCYHFGQVMGPSAVRWCREDTEATRRPRSRRPREFTEILEEITGEIEQAIATWGDKIAQALRSARSDLEQTQRDRSDS